MGLRCVARLNMEHHRWQRVLRASASYGVLALSAVLLTAGAVADDSIASGTSKKASTLSSGNTELAGGTLVLDETNKTYSRQWNIKDGTASTIDVDGSIVTWSGKLAGAGSITITDSVGNGVLTLSNSSNSYTGSTTINSGATLALIDSDLNSTTNTDSGSIAHSKQVIVNGTFDISGTVSGTTILALSGTSSTGKVILGSNTLTIYDYDSDNSVTYSDPTTFAGVISGKGNLVLSQGYLTLTGVNTYTGYTTVSTGTLTLTGAGSIASSSTVYVYSTLDMSAASSATLKSLAGSGSLVLGANNLVLTAAGNSFTGVISGTGGLILNDGTEYLSGTNTFTGGITVNGGTLELGSTTISQSVLNKSTVSFYNTSTTEMDGIISGTGEVKSIGTGVTTFTTAQTYTGATTISTGTFKLTGSGSLANSSIVTVNGAFDISELSSATLNGLGGYGTVRLGGATLTLTGSSAGNFTGTMTGTGGVILTGGSQTFSGASTYTGQTIVNGGTLILAAGASLRSTVVNNSAVNIATGSTATGSATIGSLTGAGTVTLGANTLVLSSANDTFSGVISGSGGFWVSGGTETLSGANTYTGSTTVSAGKLILSSTGSISSQSALAISGTFDATAASGTALSFTSLSGSGSVAMGAHSLTLSKAAGSFSGVISGTSGLVIAGGTEILAGENTYTGGTTIASGATLQLGTGSSGGSILGNVADNGTLSFTRNDSYTFAGSISGSGAVTQSGIGTTILTGTNSYTGGTTISSGTLQIGSGGTSGSITGNITDNGALTFSRSDGTSYSGIISGTGSVSALSGTTTFTGVNTYTGATKISSGATLSLSGSGSVAASSGVVDNGTFNVSAATLPVIASLSGSGSVVLGSSTLTLSNASGTFSGAISGAGGLALTKGAQTLSSTSTYTGATTINGGALTVTGSIASSSGVTVNSGGALAGTGTVSKLTVNSGGTVSAGSSSSAGTLTVSGNAVFNSGSTYNVYVSSTAASKLAVSGTASLAGGLTVTSTDGTYLLGQKVTVLSASSLTGSFSGSSTFTASNGAVLKETVAQDTSNVYLTIDLSQLSPVLASTATKNQKAVVAGIDAAIAAGQTLPTKIEGLGNDSSTQLASDTGQLSGEIGASLPTASRALFSPFVEAMFTHINPGSDPLKTAGVEGWASGFAGSSIVAGQESSVGSHKFRDDVQGFVIGANWKPWNSVMLGAAISAETSQFHLTGDLGKGNAKAINAGVYGYLQPSAHFYNSFAAGLSYAQMKTERVVTVSGTDNLTAKVNAISFGGRYEAGLNFGWLMPYLAGEGQMTMLPSYSEGASSGTAAFGLNYASQTANTASVEAGIRNEWNVAVTPRWVLTPDWTLRLTDRLAYVHNFASTSEADASFLGISASSYTVKGAEQGQDAVRASAGADFLFDNGFRVTSHLDTTFSKRSQAFTGFAGVAYQW